MKARSSNFVGLVFIVCLAMIWGCHSHTASQGVPAPTAASVPPEAASAPSVASEPPPPPIDVAPHPDDSSGDCRLFSAQEEKGEPIATVALGDRVDPANAPRPSNESERLLFRQLYETLVRVDCQGRVRPGLAASWHLDAGTNTWIITLRQNASFSDGTPVTASNVVSAWTIDGSEGMLRPEVRRLVRSILALDDQTLEITLRSQNVNAPLALAHTDLAIAKHMAGSVWPVGTRLTRIARDGEALEVTGPPETPDHLFTVRFLVAPGRDARDLLDEGVDLLLTRDPAVLEYAATLPQFVSVPLAWQQTHVLLIPGRARTSRPLSAEERDTLAHDAIRGEARGALGPFWWQTLADCDLGDSQTRNPSASTTGRIIYDADDSVARDLAERLVGLAGTSDAGATAILDALQAGFPGRSYQRAAGLTGEALALAQRHGNDAGYIIAFDRRPLDPCRELQVVADNASWVDPETIVPLVDTRLQAIVRRGRSGVIAEWDGGLLLVNGSK